MILNLPIVYNKNVIIRPLTLKDSGFIAENYKDVDSVVHYNFGPFETFLEARNYLNDEVRENTLYGVFLNDIYLCHFVLNSYDEKNKTAQINFIINPKIDLSNLENNLEDIFEEIVKIYMGYLNVDEVTLKISENNLITINILKKLNIEPTDIKKNSFYNRFTGEYSNILLYKVMRGVLK